MRHVSTGHLALERFDGPKNSGQNARHEIFFAPLGAKAKITLSAPLRPQKAGRRIPMISGISEADVKCLVFRQVVRCEKRILQSEDIQVIHINNISQLHKFFVG